MHDGDQQLLNPYGRQDMRWTMYSFRPCDTREPPYYPEIAITPSSFESISSMQTMLNNIPYIVVKEYFFKNEASNMLDFVKKIMGAAKEAFDTPKAQQAPIDGSKDASSSGSTSAKDIGNGIIEKVRKAFGEVTLKQAAIDIPYILYCGLRRKLYGNTYIFPYIVSSSTPINNASNDSEWNEKGGMLQGIKDMIQNVTNLVGSFAMSMIGSQAAPAELFPAPTWKNNNQDKVQFEFDLILINDHVMKARNNYMCVNTIINNNKSVQKAILAFPGALYEVWLPTGQRHLMCTGTFTLYPLGLNRKVPTDFFQGTAGGATEQGNATRFKIGSDNGDVANIKNPDKKGHNENVEVIPDAYKLSISFKSCLANNLNTSIFQYYVEMVDYDRVGKEEEKEPDDKKKEGDNTMGGDVVEGLAGKLVGQIAAAPAEPSDLSNQKKGGEGEGDGENKDAGVLRSLAKMSTSPSDRENVKRATEELVDSIETFDESTYNKKLEKFKSSMGDQAINADSVVLTIRNTQRTIRETNEFLSKLYNANNNNLWYKTYPDEELYTTYKPDYRQQLKKKYGEKLSQIREVNKKIEEVQRTVDEVEQDLTSKTNLVERNPILKRKLDASKLMVELRTQRDELVDESLQIDTQLISEAFDEHDKAVSLKRNAITFNIFKQVWNEKIMNSYEKEKLKYLTSEEKERYFSDKVMDLKKYDKYGILNHPDWFFRVAVLDYVVAEMKKLVYWFKNCKYDAYETIYQIVRKLNLLKLDVEQIQSAEEFDINRTNLFYVSDDDMQQFSKVDGLLTGNTLYQIFQSQVKLNFTKIQGTSSAETVQVPQENKELIKEQESEIELERQRKVRQDVVVRFWGSESELCRAAYKKATENDTEVTEGLPNGISSLKELKDRIITLKLNQSEDNKAELQELIGSFTNLVNVVKEALVIEKMNEMGIAATVEIGKKDGSVNANVVKD